MQPASWGMLSSVLLFSTQVSQILKLLEMRNANTGKPFYLTTYDTGLEWMGGAFASYPSLLLEEDQGKGSAASDCLSSWKWSQIYAQLLQTPEPVLAALCLMFIVGFPAKAMAGRVSLHEGRRKSSSTWHNWLVSITRLDSDPRQCILDIFKHTQLWKKVSLWQLL